LFFIDLESAGKKSQILMNPTVPSVLVQSNDTGGGNICAYTVGSTNINLAFTGTADLRVDNDPGTTGQVLTSNGTGSAPTWETPAGGGGTTVELLSAGRAGTGSISTSITAQLDWSTPSLNTASVGYASNEFTIPAGLNGYYADITAQAGGDGATTRVQLDLILQKDVGLGFADVADSYNYATRNSTQAKGSTTLQYLDPTPLATGDKYRFLFRRVGGGLNFDPSQMNLAMRFYSP
jgi:hypothetical protein